MTNFMFDSILFFLFIKKIISIIICHERCKTCSFNSTPESFECDSCINGTYLMEDSKNCYYDYELPNYYLDNDTLKPCSSPCYECIGNTNNCESCIEGYSYNKESHSCEQCPSTEYIFILYSPENCLSKIYSSCKLNETTCSKIKIENDFECPREYPLYIEEEEKKQCVLKYFENNYNNISNKIIKTQWLNKRTKIGVDECQYISMDFSSNGDLIIESNIYNKNRKKPRYFYGIKFNGRPLFYDQENNVYKYQKTIDSITNGYMLESQLIRIKLYNEDEKDYYLSCTFSHQSFEIIDFNTNKIYGLYSNKIFGDFEIFSRLFSILELKNEKKIYLFCFIVQSSDEQYYISLQKLKFFKADIKNTVERISYSYTLENYRVGLSYSITCIDFYSLNIIQCFYADINNYLTVGLFDEKNLDLINSYIIEDTPITNSDIRKLQFHQSLYLKKEISILAYLVDYSSKIFYIKMKEVKYKYNKYILEDYFLTKKTLIINENNKFSYFYYYLSSHLLKINDYKFCLTTSNYYLNELYIITFDLYSDHDTNLCIRYYNIPLKLYDLHEYKFIMSFNFYGFYGLVYTTQDIQTQSIEQYLSIFSYINGFDSKIISLEPKTVLNLNEYINTNYIENNLFGMILYGIKIISLPNSRDLGVYYFSEKKKYCI